MARIIKKWKKKLDTPWGEVLQAFVYAVMLIFVLLYFTGNGQFIYEGF